VIHVKVQSYRRIQAARSVHRAAPLLHYYRQTNLTLCYRKRSQLRENGGQFRENIPDERVMSLHATAMAIHDALKALSAMPPYLIGCFRGFLTVVTNRTASGWLIALPGHNA
jgi:hypothetical protein